MARRYYSSTAARTTLASGVDDTTTTFSVVAVSGWPASFPYTLVIDQDTINEELVEVTARSGTTLTVTRGVDGSTAVAHSAGAAVNHGVSARDFDEPNAFINGTDYVSTDGGSTVTASGASVVPLTLKGASGQTADLINLQRNDATEVLTVDKDGNVAITNDSANQLTLFRTSGATARFNFASNDSLGNQTTFARISSLSPNITDGAEEGALLFHTVNGGSVGERMRIASDGLITGTGPSLGAWTAYTPTWSATGGTPAIGNGFLGGSYVKIGKIVACTIYFYGGSTTTFAGTDWTFSLPVTAANADRVSGAAHVYNANTGAGYVGSLYGASTTSVFVGVDNAFVGSTTPGTFAVNWVIRLQATYEEA